MAQPSLISLPSQEVTAESLSAFILRRISECSGPQLPCDQAAEILGDFWERFGPESGMAICSQVFDIHDGTWRNAPVTVRRFQERQDDYFANPLLEEARNRS